MLRFVQRKSDRAWFPKPEDMPDALHQLLIARGIRSAEEAQTFLNPDVRSLHDPLLLSDMDTAIARIRRAVDADEAICIYGDYDVDGVCAAAVLSGGLKHLGAMPKVYLPSRHAEGYGLNEAAIREIAGWAKLMITVDCGVTSVELVALAKSLGLDVIVTDHHQPAEILPDCPVVNPLLNDYPYPSLCGAGVAWKLVHALAGEATAMEFVDMAALATVADVVPLTDENRVIVHLGLERINASPRLGLDALIEAAGLAGKRITGTSIAFQLAPRLNAGGRIGSAMRSFSLVTSEDAAQAHQLADELEQENTQRKQIEQQILAEAEEQLNGFDLAAHRILILSGKGWNAGVIGLAASRLVEKYHYPVVMLADQEDHMTGSCRSIAGVDIHAALCAASDTMVRFGGHKQAAGLTLLPERLEDFRAVMDGYLFENIDPNCYIPVREYDMEIDFESITQGFIAALEGMQPTGFGNSAPVFRAAAEVVEARTVGKDGAHLKLMLSQESHRLNAIAFRAGPQINSLANQADMLFTPKINAYMGRTEVQLEVRALADADVYARIQSKLAVESELQCNFLTEMFYNERINPSPFRIECINDADVRKCMAENPQGTLVLTTDFAAAVRLYRQLEPVQPDLYIGELPKDARAFNAICVCPPVEAIVTGYRRIALAGMPREYPLEGEREVYEWVDRPAWMKLLPDIDQMREVYKAVMRIGRRPVSYRTLGQLNHLVGAEAELDARTTMASLLAINDMQLITLDLNTAPIQMRRQDKRKADPKESVVWNTIQQWRV